MTRTAPLVGDTLQTDRQLLKLVQPATAHSRRLVPAGQLASRHQVGCFHRGCDVMLITCFRPNLTALSNEFLHASRKSAAKTPARRQRRRSLAAGKNTSPQVVKQGCREYREL